MLLNLGQFAFYIAAMMALGLWALRRTHSNRDYIIGGRSLGPVTSAISAGASDMSAWLLLGLPGAVYASGLVEGFWIGLGLFIGAWCNWVWVAPRLRRSTEEQDCVTLPSWFAARFQDHSGMLRISASLVIIVFFTLYVASGLKGGTLLFAHTFGASESISLLVTVGVVLSYTLLGGYLAVCWTDLIQGLLMLAALLACVFLAWMKLEGGAASIAAVKAEAFSIATGWITALSLLAWGLGYFGQPHILARFIGIKQVKDVALARRIGLSWMLLCLLTATAIGLLGIALQAQLGLAGVNGEQGSSEAIFLALTTALFHPVVSGFILAAVLAAVMSTADSQLLVLASTISEDLNLKQYLNEKKLAGISRLCVLVFAVLAWWIAANDQGSILALVGYAWSGFGAAFGPVILLSLLWQGVNRWGALAGILSGAIAVVIFKNTVEIEGEYFFELLPAFFISLACITLVSLLTAKHP